MADLVSCLVDTDSGPGYDYSSLNAADAANFGATSADLVSEDEYVECECACSSGSADTAAVHVTGFTVDSTRYVHIFTDTNRHNGAWDTSGYRLVVNNNTACLRISNSYVRAVGLQLQNTYPTSDSWPHREISATTAGTTHVRIDSCVCRCTRTPNTANAQILMMSQVVSIVVNTVVYGGYKGIHIYSDQTGHEVVCYNNTVADCSYRGYELAPKSPWPAWTLHLKNCLADNNNPDFYINTFNLTTDYADNMSSDTSAPGGDAHHSASNSFAGTGDYHLDSADDAVGEGTDLSSDSTYPITTDIDGDTRSDWDIGADEIASSGVQANVSPASATWNAGANGVQLGGISVDASPVSGTWAAGATGISLSLQITTASASGTWNAGATGITLGGIGVSAASAVATWNAGATGVGLGGVSVNAAPASGTWAAGTTGITLGGIAVSAVSAAATWNAGACNVSLGLVVTLSSASASWHAGSTGITLGGISVSASSAGGTWNAQALDISLGLEVSITPASGTWGAGATGVSLGLVVTTGSAAATWNAGATDVSLGNLAITILSAAGIWTASEVTVSSANLFERVYGGVASAEAVYGGGVDESVAIDGGGVALAEGTYGGAIDEAEP